MRRLLIPLSWLYGLAVVGRNLLFDIGVLRTRSAGVPAIAIGNITAGGTGKTPLVEYLAGVLLARGLRVAVVSRGYGRITRGVVIVADGVGRIVTAEQGGDEAVQVARRFPGLRVVVGERRVDAARTAVRALGAEVVVLDDAFQHRYLRRDLDIVLLDARTDPFRQHLLPAGLRREPLRELRRAGIVALSRIPDGATDVGWRDRLQGRTAAPVVSFRIRPGRLRPAADGTGPDAEEVRAARVVAVSGIADNARFAADVRSAGCTVCATLGFADHHRYTAADVETILAAVREHRAAFAVTTTKDLARLADGPGKRLLENVPVMVLPVDVQWVEGEDTLLGMVDAVVKRKQQA